MAAAANAILKILEHAVGHQELRVFGPAIEFLYQFDFFCTERLAVGGAGVLLVRRSIANVAVYDDECGPVVGVEKLFEGASQGIEVIGVADVGSIPAVAAETGGHVFAEGPVGGAVEGDGVGVVNPAEVGQLEMSGKRSSFAADAFHHVAVAANRVHVVSENFEAGTVVARRQPLAGDRHAHAVADSLAQGAGCSFGTGSDAVLGMAGSPAAELAELLDVVE